MGSFGFCGQLKFRASLFLVFASLVQKTMSSAKHVEFTFVLVNGKVVPVNRTETTEPEASGISMAIVQSILMAILLVVGLICSLILVTTILSSITLRKLRQPLYNIILLHIAIICLLECLFNMLLSVIYVAGFRLWKRSSLWLCYFNSFFMDLLMVAYTFFLFALVVDRALALRDPLKYKKSINSMQTRLGLMLCWILALASSVPLMSKTIESWPFPSRFGCQVMDDELREYGIVTALFCFIIPWVLIIAAIFYIRGLIASERRKERKQKRGQNGNKFSTHTAIFFANAQMWNELRNVMLVSLLLIIYILLLVPYIVIVKVDQIQEKYDVAKYRSLLDVSENAPSLTDTTTTTSSSTSTNVTSAQTTTVLIGEIPEVKEDWLGKKDVVVVWLRYIHFTLVPIVIFVVHKNLRKKVKDLLSWWRPNSVENAPTRPISSYIDQIRKEKKIFKHHINFKVPVLFATSDGLHMRAVDQENSSGAKSKASKGHNEGNLKLQWTVEPEFVTEFCDLQLVDRASPEKNDLKQSDSNFGSTITMKKAKKAEEMEKERGRHDPHFDESSPLIEPHVHSKVQFDSRVEEIPQLIFTDTETEDLASARSSSHDDLRRRRGRQSPDKSPRRRDRKSSY